MQRAYVKALYEIIKQDSNVISCLSDSGTDYDELIAREFPNQVVNFGISENNKVAAAAGMAATGKIPFVYTTSAFIAYRSYEFLRDDICLQNRNVKLVGMGTGVSWSTLGATHHTTEDIALLRSLPNLTVIVPATPLELQEAVRVAYEHNGPVYIRMGMSGEKEIFDEKYHFELGKNVFIQEGNDVTIFTTGSIVTEVIEATRQLSDDGISARIINVNTLKPLDVENIIDECKRQTRIISVEEHNTIGGLGTAISDVIAENGLRINLKKIGLIDKFAHGFGTKNDVLKSNHLDSISIYNTISDYLKNDGSL
ncbi:MAG: transketolase C-terminal domain-containing protein [Acutalibacteraceae bacterium]|nr:transketolase C-terminal domain-containing protein [Acutalibacteraceae bacterium]